MIDRILETKRQEVSRLRAGTHRRQKPVIPLLCTQPVNIIAELKRRSPSAGFIADIDDERIRTYGRYATAISVLTDATYFGGSFQFLAEVAEESDLPILCKDFIIDPVQIDLAYAAGADLVLLIARILTEKNLKALYAHAADLGLACLVEIHGPEDLAKIEGLNAPIIGVNARNLDSLEMDLDAAARLLEELDSPVRVAESGIRSRADMERMKNANAFLIGETLMRSKDVSRTFEELLYGKDQVLRHDQP